MKALFCHESAHFGRPDGGAGRISGSGDTGRYLFQQKKGSVSGMTDIVSSDLRAHDPVARRDGGRREPQAKSPSARNPMRNIADYLNRPSQSLGTLAFGAVVAVVLLIGWLNRHEKYLTPEDGLGYQLGIAGAVMMLLVFLYPLRKKLKLLGRLGRVSHWFRMHMFLGILGPVLILYHSNFELGSTNSSIALIAMLTVALSGLVGRFFYKRIHMGLYGKKARVAEILVDTKALKRAIGVDLNDFELIAGELQNFEKTVLAPYRGLLESAFSVLLFGPRAYHSRKSILRRAHAALRSQAGDMGWSRREQRARLRTAEFHLLEYFAAARKASQFVFYERLFSLWHVLHLPMFLFLIVATIIHIVAVHLY